VFAQSRISSAKRKLEERKNKRGANYSSDNDANGTHARHFASMRRMYRSQVVLVGRLWFLLSVSLLFNLLVLVRVRWPSRGNNNTNNIDNNDDEGVVDELTASKSRFPSTSITSTDGIGFGIGAEEGEREQLPSDFYRLLNLTEQQCKTAFPDLTRDIDANVKLGPFKLKKAHATGPLQAGIRDGKVGGLSRPYVYQILCDGFASSGACC